MTRLGVMADSHRSRNNIRMALSLMGDCDYIIHLGDHDTDMDGMGVSESRLYTVPGNCDPLSFSPGLRIALKAREAGARLALYGHSHQQRADDDGQMLCLNPGALKNGCFAVVTLDNGRVTYEMKTLSDE